MKESFRMKTTNKITAWSFSRYNTYRKCPFQAKCKYVLKLKEPGSAATDNGTARHKDLEDYLKGTTKRLPAEAKSLEKEYKVLKARKPEVELEVAFTSKWERTDWFNWQNAWCRVKIDAIVPPVVENPVVDIKDHKTGKLKDNGEYGEQLELYSLTGLLIYPVAETAIASLLFIDHGKEILGEVHKRSEIPKLKKMWELRVEPMLSDTKFKPTPGFQCKWCHFRKSNDGPCSEG